MMEKKKSVGILIGVVIAGLIFMLYSLINLYQCDFVISEYYGSPFGVEKSVIFFAVINLLLFIIAIGLFMKRHWARISAILGALFIIVYSIYIIIYYIKIFSKMIINIDTLIAISSSTFSLIIIYFFTRPKVKEQFK